MLKLPGLTAEMPLGDTLAVLLQACGQEIDQHIAAFLDGTDPDSPRKARVAIRRLTTALDAFAPILRKKHRIKLRGRAKNVFRKLGRLRDGEMVLLAQGADQEKLEALRAKAAQALRSTGAITLGAQIQSTRVLQELLRKGKGQRKERAKPLIHLAARVLSAARGRFLEHELDLNTASQSQLHDLRKDLKAYRYLSEFFQPCWPDDQDAEVRRHRFQALQDALGSLTDLAVIRKAAGVTEDEQLGAPQEIAGLTKAQSLWTDLRQEAPWWPARKTK